MVQKKISVKEIAEMAGTSVATVSRVINQNGRFSKETEKRVRDVIEQYGYRPNQLARSLRVNHTQVIGILVPDITNEFFASITKEVQRHLLSQNYMTLICSTNENVMEAKEQLRMLLAQKVSGIIYIGGEDITESIHIPTVYIDRDPRDMETELDENYVMIECDNMQGGYLAGEELAKKGARRIAYVCYGGTLSTVKKRIEGFQHAMEEAGIELQPDCGVYVSEVSIEEGARATEQILESRKDVDGIFYMSDLLAVGGIGCLTGRGIRVPEQVRVVGFDDISMSRILCPGLTTVRQPVAEFGRLAALRIVDMIGGKEIAQQRHRIPVELVVRGTT
ncbi:MAG: LacI family DNA-binding transcriptional regulator [Eubacteriales bacterium]|nr:LacI family DNA-binding transcriptional regulator [Eubacteriales bacterium]